MNYPLTSSFDRLHIWDAYKCHTAPSVKLALKQSKVDMAVIPGGCTGVIQAPDVSWNKPFKAALTEEFNHFMEFGEKSYTKGGNMRAMSMMQICDAVVRSWEKITPEIIKKSFRVCGQVPDPKAAEITSFKEGKICHPGLTRLEHLLSLDIHKVDLENLCELSEAIIQQIDEIMSNDQGDGADELLENELCVDAEEEDDLVDQELNLVWEDDGEPVVDDDEEEDGDSDVEPESQSLFIQSSLNSIQRGAANNSRKRPNPSLDMSPTLKAGPSSKRWCGEEN